MKKLCPKNFKEMFALSLLLSLSTKTAYSEVFMDGGTVLGPSELPQMQVYSSNAALCTINLIGPRVLITAAHCIEVFKMSHGVFRSIFFHQPVVHPRALPLTGRDRENNIAIDYDFALAVLQKDADIVPFTVNLHPDLEIGDSILLAGAGSPTTRIRKIGRMKLFHQSSMSLTLRRDDHLTFIAPGDSGGAALAKYPDGHIEMIGVNSTGIGAEDRTKTFGALAAAYTAGITLISSDGGDFLRTFATENKVGICGINLNCNQVHTEH